MKLPPSARVSVLCCAQRAIGLQPNQHLLQATVLLYSGGCPFFIQYAEYVDA